MYRYVETTLEMHSKLAFVNQPKTRIIHAVSINNPGKRIHEVILLNNAINISLTFKDMGFFVLWILLSGVLLYILMILIKFYRSFKQIMKLVDDKRIEIDSVIDELPGITKNINAISSEVAHGMEAFHDTVDNIAETSDNVTEALAEKSGMAGKFSSLMHTVSIIKSLYDQYFGDTITDEDDEKVMVCKEVSKSDITMEKQEESETSKDS